MSSDSCRGNWLFYSFDFVSVTWLVAAESEEVRMMVKDSQIQRMVVGVDSALDADRVSFTKLVFPENWANHEEEKWGNWEMGKWGKWKWTKI